MQNDADAFNELFRRYCKKIHVFVIKKIQNKDATEDIVQDIFASLWERRSSLIIHHVSTYLYTAAKYKAIKFAAAEISDKKNWDYYKQYIPKSEELTAEMVGFNDLMEQVEESLNCLPQRSKEVFHQSRFEGKSTKELADRYHISEKAIEYHITQSIRQLKLSLKDFYLMITLGFFM